VAFVWELTKETINLTLNPDNQQVRRNTSVNAGSAFSFC
jgi:hypothetical protein